MIAVYDPLPTVKALKRKEEILNKVDSAEHLTTALCFCIPFASQFSHFRRPPDDRPNRSLRLKQQTAVRSGSSWVNPVRFWFWCENGPAMIFSFFESFWILHSLDSLAWCDDSLLGIGLHVNEAEAGESGPWASCWKGRVGRGSEQLESMGKPQMLQIA